VTEGRAHLVQPRLGGGKLLADLVELLGDLVELRCELVHPSLDLGYGRLRRGASTGCEDHKPADRDQPGRDRDTAAKQGLKPGIAAR